MKGFDRSVNLREGYREMARDGKREREAREWIEGLVGDGPGFEWFENLDRLNSDAFMPEGRNQPSTPKRKVFKWITF